MRFHLGDDDRFDWIFLCRRDDTEPQILGSAATLALDFTIAFTER